MIHGFDISEKKHLICVCPSCDLGGIMGHRMGGTNHVILTPGVTFMFNYWLMMKDINSDVNSDDGNVADDFYDVYSDDGNVTVSVITW